MKEKIELSDLDCENWQYPNGIKTKEEIGLFIRFLPQYDDLLEREDKKALKRPISKKKKDEIRERALVKMKEELAHWLLKKPTASEIEKNWIGVCLYLRLIQSEFDILFAGEDRRHSNLDVLPDPILIQLWQTAYELWKVQTEIHIKFLFPGYKGPDFLKKVTTEKSLRQNEWDMLFKR